MISEVLQKIQGRLEQFKEMVGKIPDQDLENIMDHHFQELGTNINANLDFMAMIVTRAADGQHSEICNEPKLSNQELEKYFQEHWDVLIFP